MSERVHQIFGEFDHARLDLAVEAARELLATEAVGVYVSSFDGQRLFRLHTASVEIETSQGSSNLVTGAIEAPVEGAKLWLRSFSSALTRRGVVHRLELYDEEELLAVFDGSLHRDVRGGEAAQSEPASSRFPSVATEGVGSDTRVDNTPCQVSKPGPHGMKTIED